GQPERARGTRASEGPAGGRPRNEGVPRGTRASEGPAGGRPRNEGCRAARARAKALLRRGAHEKQVLRACGAQDDRLARLAKGKEGKRDRPWLGARNFVAPESRTPSPESLATDSASGSSADSVSLPHWRRGCSWTSRGRRTRP